MSYAVKQDLIERFKEAELAQLTDPENAATEIDDTTLDRALVDADAEIDGYLGGRYRLPLATVPRLLTNIACDIARYRLYDDRATEQVTTRYKDAVRLLEKIQKGDVSLGLDAAQQPTQTTGGPQFDEPARVFSRERLADY
ncbi:MAG: gp436 family protein [Methylibium sp.]